MKKYLPTDLAGEYSWTSVYEGVNVLALSGWSLENDGAVLGVFPDWPYRDSAVQLRPGDRLLLFTDGITEAGLPGGEEFGEQRLTACAQASVGASTEQLKTRLLGEVKQFCAAQLSDDATLIVVSALEFSSREPQSSDRSFVAL